MPNREGETSVYRTTDLTTQQIYEIGEIHVANIIRKALLGRADITSLSVLSRDLKVQPHTAPHPRHANIIGWPSEKSERKLIAIELAAEAQLHLINDS